LKIFLIRNQYYGTALQAIFAFYSILGRPEHAWSDSFEHYSNSSMYMHQEYRSQLDQLMVRKKPGHQTKDNQRTNSVTERKLGDAHLCLYPNPASASSPTTYWSRSQHHRLLRDDPSYEHESRVGRKASRHHQSSPHEPSYETKSSSQQEPFS
jgi:hypothetical protein